MTLNEIVYDLKGVLRNHRFVDDDRLDIRKLKEWVHTERAAWIRRESAKSLWRIPDQIIQSLGCVELEVSDRSQCPVLLTTSGSILRTSQDIPRVIELKNRDGIIDVGPVDKIALPFSYVTPERARTFVHGKYNSTFICAFPYLDRIYLWSKETNENFYKYIRYIRVNGIFNDPTEAARFNHINGQPCYSDDDEYPMSPWMWKYMKEEIKQANLGALYNIPADKTSDADDVTREQQE